MGRLLMLRWHTWCCFVRPSRSTACSRLEGLEYRREHIQQPQQSYGQQGAAAPQAALLAVRYKRCSTSSIICTKACSSSSVGMRDTSGWPAAATAAPLYLATTRNPYFTAVSASNYAACLLKRTFIFHVLCHALTV
jgi:hypothetical protein